MEANNEDETEFPGSEAFSRLISAVKKPFQSLWVSGDSEPKPVWDVSDEYDFTHASRGTMIIFNNEKFRRHTARQGSDLDAENLRRTFSDLGFDVTSYDNQSRNQMLSVLKKAAKQDYNNSDCFVCAILSHGDEVHVVDSRKPGQRERNDVVYATDQIVLTSEIVQLFQDHKCKSLKGKPRLFFIQACRGNVLDSGVDLPVVVDEVDAGLEEIVDVTPCPIYKDFLIMYATPPGYYAFRRPDTGSWFIEALCKVFSHPKSQNQSLNNLLTAVIRLVAQEYESWSGKLWISGKKQTPCFASMLVKDVYFRPNQVPPKQTNS